MKKSSSHVAPDGTPTMVDISNKSSTSRTAVARSLITFPFPLADIIKDGDILSKKGSVFHTAIIAGTQAAKSTHHLIPFCHTLPLDSIKIQITPFDKNSLEVICEAKTTYKTGVEMEALCGASIASLTIYDMCKSMSHGLEIVSTKLVNKTGGKSDYSSSTTNMA